MKKKLEIDPLHADTVRLNLSTCLGGRWHDRPDGREEDRLLSHGHRIFTRDGGRWGIGQVHRILTRKTYVGEHEFNKRSKTKELKPISEIVVVPVPPIIDRDTFDAVQKLLKARNPKVMPARVISGPTMLTGLIHCAKCGGAMIRHVHPIDRNQSRTDKCRRTTSSSASGLQCAIGPRKTFSVAMTFSRALIS